MIAQFRDEFDILARAQQLTGHSVGWLAAQLNQALPINLKHAKGYIGQLVEQWLGVLNRNYAGPDFPHIPLEIKTIPVNGLKRPMQNTFVAYASTMARESNMLWPESIVWKKLQRILWIPIEITDSWHLESLSNRRMFAPLLWSPSPQQAAVLRADWEEIMDAMTLGDPDPFTGQHGRYLQLRQKKSGIDDELQTKQGRFPPQPQSSSHAFYLKTSLTAAVLQGDA